MNKKIAKLIKKTGISLNKEEIHSFNATYDKLVNLKSTINSKVEEDNFNELVNEFLKMFSKLDDKSKKEKTLFPNNIPEEHFGIPSIFVDNYNNALNIIDDQEEIIAKRYGRSKQILIDTKEKFGFKIGKEIQEVDSPEKIFEIIRDKIKSGAILQHYCALWNYALKQESFYFRDVHIDRVLETFLKKPKNGYFRSTTRENFTKSIRILEDMYLRVPIKEKKGEVTYINIPLVDFRLSPENKTGNIILKLVGSIFGGRDVGKYRGRIFPEGIFKLDSRTEGRRIKLAFILATRFDQLNQKPIKWTRKKLIEQAGLIDTNNHDKHDASKKLIRTLERLKETNCISDFFSKKISTNDNEEIVIYSPIQKKLQ